IHLAGLGQREDALTTITEAVQAYRELAQARPAVHESELEQSLRALALIQEMDHNPGGDSAE
ncbi:hypothetical protein AB0G02_08630, partial [Actinosynnema sp. NPDC023658]|uniref:hypothetical protein n=1 Tax=Actinosynnema sp. NPDC023658 TaxID=3155465 RepID=UPI0033E5897A